MNKTAAIHAAATEWGGKARKREARLRGLDAAATRENIAEQLADMDDNTPLPVEPEDEPKDVEAADPADHDDALDPYCFVCSRPTDHRGEHDDLVAQGLAMYDRDGTVWRTK